MPTDPFNAADGGSDLQARASTAVTPPAVVRGRGPRFQRQLSEIRRFGATVRRLLKGEAGAGAGADPETPRRP